MAIYSRFWKIFDLVLLIAVLAIGGWAIRGYFSSGGPDTGAQVSTSSVKVSIILPGGENIESLIDPSTASGPLNVMSSLKVAAAFRGVDVETKEYPGMGSIVTRIGSEKNGNGGAYWQFWVNGKYAEKGADQTPVNSGDVIEWRFSSSTPQ